MTTEEPDNEPGFWEKHFGWFDIFLAAGLIGVTGYLIMLVACLWGAVTVANQHPAVGTFLFGLVLFLFASGVNRTK